MDRLQHIDLQYPDCFGTGLTLVGRPPRLEKCDTCQHARPCLIRQVRSLQDPPDRQRWDAFVAKHERPHRG